MTARLAPALAGSSSHVITMDRRFVPGGHDQSPGSDSRRPC